MSGVPEKRPDVTNPGERRSAPPVDLNVINYQVGALQTSLDRGLTTLERAMEKGFDGVSFRLDKIEARQQTVETKQARQDGRLDALEEFKDEQDRRAQEDSKVTQARLDAAVDSSEMWKMVRLLAIIGTSVVAASSGVVAILVGLGIIG